MEEEKAKILQMKKVKTLLEEAVVDKHLDHIHMKKNPGNSGLRKIPRDFDWMESPKT